MADFSLNIKVNGVEQAVSSVGELENALKGTNVELDKVESNSDVFKNAVKDANNLNKSIDEISASAKNLGQTVTAGAQISKGFKDAGESADGLNKSINDTATKSTSLRAELRQITQELQNLEPGSKRFQELSARAGELRDTIADTSAVINATAGNVTENFGRALTSTLSLGVAGFQAVSAAQTLFGEDNEEIQKSLAQFGALINLSQAIETFGGLGDKITEIKAGFQGLFGSIAQTTTATTAAAGANVANTGALVAETAATGAATVATTALGTAMKALPIIAIAAAVASLVAGIYSYVSANSDAKEEEEARKKALEDLIAEQEKQRTEIAAESGEFVLLITRLGQTNQGSQERLDLIKQINDQYGTTLKNLADETQFQAQLNVAINEYIRFQTNKFNLNKNQEKFNKLLEEQGEIQKEVATAQARVTVEQERQSQMQDRINPLLREATDALKNQQDALASNKSAIEALAKSTTNLLTEQEKLTNGGKTYEETQEEQRKKAEALRKAEEARKDAISDLKLAQDALSDSTAKLAQQTDDLRKKEAVATKIATDDIIVEKELAIKSAQEEYAEKIKLVRQEVTDKRLRASTIKQLEADLDAFLKKIRADYDKRIQESVALEIKAQQEKIDQLLIQQKILQTEITAGDQNTTDTFTALEIRKLEAVKARVDQQLAIEKTSLEDLFNVITFRNDDYLNLLADRVQQEKVILAKQRDEEISQIGIQNFQKLKNQEQYYESTYGVALKYNKDLGKFELDENQEKLQKLSTETEDEYQKRLDNQKLIQKTALENINQEAVNLEKEKNAELEIVNEEYRTKELAADKKATDDAVNYKISKFQEGLQLLSSFVEGAQAIVDVVNQTENQNQVARNEAAAASYQAQADAIQAQLEKDLASTQYTEEQKVALKAKAENQIKGIVENGNKAIDKSNRDLAEKQFKRQKALNITTALINGAQAVLQAIAQFGPPPSPLGIAGIVAAGIITAAQVAAIASQKFDGGSTGAPTSVSTPTVSDTTGGGSVANSPLATASSGGFTGFNQGLTTTSGAGATTTPITGGLMGQRVYVLESDITNTQRRVETLESNATFG